MTSFIEHHSFLGKFEHVLAANRKVRNKFLFYGGKDGGYAAGVLEVFHIMVTAGSMSVI